MDKKKNIIIHLIFWSLFFILTNRIISLKDDSESAFIFTIVFVLSLAIVSYLNVWLFVPKLLTRKKYVFYTIVVLFILIFISSLFVRFDSTNIFINRNRIRKSVIAQNRIHKPFIPYKKRMRQKRKPVIFLRPKFILIFFINSLFIFVSTIIRLSLDFARKERQQIQIEKERLLIETQYLRSQMNPHFFLNALNNLQYINRLLPDEAGKYINTLAEMMRYVTYDCKNDKVPIKKEVKYIENYIYFQQVKDDETAINFQIDIQDKDAPIEPMLLMPFIENAFKYGVYEDSREQAIFIGIRQDEKAIYFSCKNSINHNIKSNTDPNYSGLGIKNVKDRLNANYPKQHTLKIDNSGIYFSVDLKLNL